jgi:peptide/nickel transport system permease protein
MTTYALRRLLHAVPLVVGISILLFAVVQAAPGGPEAALLSTGRAVDPEVVAAYRERLGTDRSPAEQYLRWLGAVARGDLGTSFSTGRPVVEMIAARLPATLALMGAGFAMAALGALAAGVVGAVRPGSRADHAATAFAFGGLAMPAFWFALVLQLTFGVWLEWLPVSGIRSPGSGGALDRLAHLVLPTIVLSLRYLAGWSRYLRAALQEVLAADFIRTARAAGLPEWRVVLVHGLPNALGPLASAVALDLGALFSGAVITETVFAWPGLGRMFVTAMFARDYPVLMGLLLLGSVAVVVLNLVADLVYGWLDPRIRYA